MKTRLHGTIARPAVAVVGVWDPLLPDHHRLFADLRAHAAANDLAAVAVVLDPPPQALLYGPADAPVFHDLRTRLRLLLGEGLDAVVSLHLSERDLLAGAEAFFDHVSRRVALRELWLGARQTLGRGAVGSVRAIDEAAARRGIAQTRLPDLRPPTGAVQRLLAEGRIAEAGRLVGQAPIRSRPRGNGSVRLAWQPGRYRAVPLADPVAPLDTSTSAVDAIPAEAGLVTFAWPDPAVPYLAFVRGPGDPTARDVRARHPAPLPATALAAQ